MIRPVTRALISVSDKTGLAAFATFLAGLGVEILSTGGTAKALRDAGLSVTDVSDHTGFPEIMDGRVKTLHPKIHGGLLGRRAEKSHVAAMEKHAIAPIDLVVVNLYPFEQTVAKGAPFEECIEHIDIGGPSMIRSAAKNHEDVLVVVDPADYALVQEEMQRLNGATELVLRCKLAGKAYAATAAYDGAISRWFAAKNGEEFPPVFTASGRLKQVLRYGENPHQQAAFYIASNPQPGVVTARQLQGKELSYNNINDTDAAFELVSDFAEPAVAIVKHANPCGVARGGTMHEAYRKALACDPVSAYGGIVALNRPLDAKTAEEIVKIFVEVVIAPHMDKAAIEILEAKKNVRLLVTGAMPETQEGEMIVKSIGSGYLLQHKDQGCIGADNIRVVSKRAPTEKELADMLFAFAVCKHVKSNAIVLAKDLGTIGIGAGQMSRVDSTRIACWKADEAKLSTQGAVLASDAFFPFADNIEAAAKAGITAVIQPGGSIRDEEIIAAADAHNMAMVVTGMRHFRH